MPITKYEFNEKQTQRERKNILAKVESAVVNNTADLGRHLDFSMGFNRRVYPYKLIMGSKPNRPAQHSNSGS